MPTRPTRPGPPSRGRATAAALALLLGCTPTERPGPGPAASEGTDTEGPATAEDEPVRIKGLAPHLVIHRQRDGQVEQLRDGQVAHAGDLIQMSYVAAGNRHGVVVSIDGSGLVTLHHPSRPDAPAELVARGEHALDHAFELDDARSYERFVLVTSGDEPLSAREVLDAARRLAQHGSAARHLPLPLPERWRQSSVTLHKRP